MEKKTAYCLLFLVLLVPYTTLGALANRVPKKTQKNDRLVAAVPAVYYGATVSTWVWQALVAAFGGAAVGAAIHQVVNSDSHVCANNRGWCRQTCFDHEYIDWYYTDVCGSYKCCRPNN